ncbi:hypothetical protein F4778DRAFT_186531 [Xylariomycetidae sp. FL2044]|nr:hypothetical protein F4778DRAFT_186531 [Xylariomycetidae sp. FL2044]
MAIEQHFAAQLILSIMAMDESFLNKAELEQLAASNRQAWNVIREQHELIIRTAESMEAAREKEFQLNLAKLQLEEATKGQKDAVSLAQQQQRLSPVETLPEEIQIQILKYLDYASLYRVSQTTAHFLRLSFDGTLEADPEWRAFRHTVDGLGDGPRKRVALSNHKGEATKEYPVFNPVPKARLQNKSGTQISNRSVVQLLVDDSEDEGETMLEYMRRTGGRR